MCILGMLVVAIPLKASDVSEERSKAFAPIHRESSKKIALLNEAQPLTENFDYVQLLDRETDVLLVGEEHRDSNPAREVNLMIKQLSRHYPNNLYVASEFLLAEEQPLLDQFAAGTISYEKLRSQCVLPHRSFVAQVAKRYGVKVIGLDESRAGYNNYAVWASSKQGINSRNQFWTKQLVALKKKNPRAKIILHAGSTHTQLSSAYVRTMPELLKRAGMRTKTLEFVSEYDPEWKQLRLNISRDTLFVIPPELKENIMADYVIYLASKPFSAQEKKQIQQAQRENAQNNGNIDPDHPLGRVYIQNGRRE